MASSKILEQRWKWINHELRRMGCNFSIPKIRPYQDGAHEIVGIKSLYLESRPFYHIVTFEIKKPFSGESGQFSVKFSSGVLVIPVIEGKIVLVEQFRLTQGKWPWELPRMFIEEPTVEKVGLQAVETVFKDEIEEALEGEPRIISVDLIHPGIFDDTGMSMSYFPVYLVKIGETKLKNVPKNDLRRNGIRFNWQTFDLLEIRKAMLPSETKSKGMQIVDSHTMSAIMSLQNLIDFKGYSLV